jgi:hypothetical protein
MNDTAKKEREREMHEPCCYQNCSDEGQALMLSRVRKGLPVLCRMILGEISCMKWSSVVVMYILVEASLATK